MSPPGTCLQEEFIDQDLPMVTLSPRELDTEMSCVYAGLFDLIEFTVIVGPRRQRVRFFPDLRHAYPEGTDEIRFEGATAVFLDESGQEISPRYQAFMRYAFRTTTPDGPSGEIRLWPAILS